MKHYRHFEKRALIKSKKIITHAEFDILVNNFGIEDMLTLLSKLLELRLEHFETCPLIPMKGQNDVLNNASLHEPQVWFVDRTISETGNAFHSGPCITSDLTSMYNSISAIKFPVKLHSGLLTLLGRRGRDTRPFG